MSWTEKVSIQLARQIKTEDSPYTIGQISHGIELAIIYLLNAVTLLLSSYLLGLFYEAILIASLYILHRSVTGGLHLRNVWSCLVGGVLMILLSSMLISNLPNLGWATYFITFFLYMVSFFINYRYAPAEHTYVSTDETIKKICRKIIISLLLIGCSMSEILVYFDYEQLSYILSVSVFLQSLHLHPVSYDIIARIENIFSERADPL